MAKYSIVELKVKKGKLTGLDQKPIVEKNGLKYGNVIYIYHSSKTGKVYIGQTKHFIERNSEHYNGKEEKFNKAEFDEVLVVFSKFFDSALDDVERTLITFFKEDYAKGSRKSRVSFDDDIINRNGGNFSPNYRDREKVATGVILPLWENVLYKKGWVKTKQLNELREAALVKYSPIKNLTRQQECIIKKILSNPNKSYVINGDAGTGKTVMLTNLVARLVKNQKNKKVAVVVQPNWVKTAKEIFRIYGIRNGLWIGTSVQLIKSQQNYDIIIVDEAHKLSRNYSKQMSVFNKVYKGKYKACESHLEIIKQIGKQVVLMYDVLQEIRPANITRNQFKSLTRSFNKEYLTTQFRINVPDKSYNSDDYINGIKWLLYKDTGLLRWTNFNKNFNRAVFKENNEEAYFGYFTDHPLNNLFDWIEKDRNFHHDHVNRVLSGLFKEWRQSDGRDPSITHFEENGLKKRWNSTQDNWINSKDTDAEDQIGSVFAVQGIDLNKVGVLIGDDLKVDERGRLYADPNNFYNVNGKYTNEEMEDLNNQKEFTLFVLNIYYVLLTRGIDGVRIGIWNNDDFRKYMETALEIKK